MSGDIQQAREAIRRCRDLREIGSVEAVLRSEFQSRLRLIFQSEEDEKWLNHYSAGTEAKTKVASKGSIVANRFIDNLVGSTTIEYEADLRRTAKFNEGFKQVREHAAGLVRSGTPASQVRGILSDTVDWYAYDVVLAADVDPAFSTLDDISLIQIEELHLESDGEVFAQRLIQFVRKHLAREQSRPLRAIFLALDLGLDSGPYRRTSEPLAAIVDRGRANDSSITLATDLWSAFVDYLEGDTGAFRTEAYVDEVYLSVLSRLLSANVLAGHAVSSDDDELRTILDGSYFHDHYQLSNMVEPDYFGWLTRPSYIDELIPLAREIQQDLYAYDFSYYPEEDLFGRLMAQLARRSQRKLLGQEWTPAWLARLLAERCLDNLPDGEMPHIVDMCCGSGSMLAEVLKATKERYDLTSIESLHNVVTGFDIDPLAVSLSKTTWVVTLASEIKAAINPVIIPIYHADSLFAVTPVSSSIPFPGESETIEISLDGSTIEIPSQLVQPNYKELFDRIVDWAYDEALDARARGAADQLTREIAEQFLNGALAASGTNISEDLFDPLVLAIYSLALRMSELAVANRNGIWAFILRNTYRPGLLSGQFNGLVSNPPWLAMSGLAENPYKEALTARARLYGIRPSAQSFLHLELGTTHLIHAVDRYLKPGASVACLVPGTVFNGHHHQLFRQCQFMSAPRPVLLDINEVWQIARDTFKYPGAAVIAHKRAHAGDPSSTVLSGFVANESGLEAVDFSVRTIGTGRTAWVLEKDGLPAASSGLVDLPHQGADLMPRTCVCIDIMDDGVGEIRVNTPDQHSEWGFTVKAAKELKHERFVGRVAPRFIHHIVQSENLLPFMLGRHCAPIAIPAERNADGDWVIYDESDIRRMGLTQTARRFQRINARLVEIGQGKTLQQRIDERGKLSKQVFGEEGYLVLTGAGGKHICAACLPVESAHSLVIDQTVYWQVVGSLEEAYYRVGILNSHALTEAITPFNPRGAFGERHIHTLPYRLMPPFDPLNEDHLRIAAIAQHVENVARTIVENDSYLNDPSRALHVRRTRLRGQLKDLDEFQELELLCAALLGTTAGYDEDA